VFPPLDQTKTNEFNSTSRFQNVANNKSINSTTSNMNLSTEQNKFNKNNNSRSRSSSSCSDETNHNHNNNTVADNQLQAQLDALISSNAHKSSRAYRKLIAQICQKFTDESALDRDG
jgi:hypothetical protein